MKDENKKIARLIKQIQRGNQSAFEEFYKLTSPKAYFIALKITQNEHDAEDILQESYIKAIEKIKEIDTSQNVMSWFLKIVSNKSKDLLKSRNRLVFEGEEETVFEEIPEEKAEFCPEEKLNQEELRLEVMAAIDELTDEKRACIMMMYFGDMSVKEIAESIEVPESTVKNRLYTARKDLRTKFEKNGSIFHGVALGGLLIWALNKTSLTASAAFVSSAASAEIAAGATAAYSAGTAATATAATASTTAATTAAASTAASTAASAGTGIAAKIAVASVAQKIAVGVAATAVIGGSTAGVVTVVKNSAPEETTTQIIEEVTTAPVFTTEYVFNEVILTETSTQTDFSTEKKTIKNTTRASTKRTSTTEHTTVPSTTNASTKKETTTKAKKTTTTKPITTTTTLKETTTQVSTTQTTTRKETTTRKVTTTQEETTTRKATTTTQKSTTTTEPTTTEPTTTQPTTQAPATLVIDIIDMNGDVADTLNLTVDAGTEMTWEYLISLIKEKGYEAKAGVYGDGVGAVAESGTTYTFEAEL